MVKKLAENKPKPSKLCSSLCNREQHLILSALQCSLWQSYQALIQQPMIFLFVSWDSFVFLAAGY